MYQASNRCEKSHIVMEVLHVITVRGGHFVEEESGLYYEVPLKRTTKKISQVRTGFVFAFLEFVPGLLRSHGVVFIRRYERNKHTGPIGRKQRRKLQQTLKVPARFQDVPGSRNPKLCPIPPQRRTTRPCPSPSWWQQISLVQSTWPPARFMHTQAS